MTFENTLDGAIIRITPGSEHARVDISLYIEIIEKIASISGHGRRSVEPFSATLLQVPGVRNKEGDEGFGQNTRVGRSVWPSVTMEFGYSGGENFLHLDSQWWLINSTGRTRFVILISVTKPRLRSTLNVGAWLGPAAPGLDRPPPVSRRVSRISTLTLLAT